METFNIIYLVGSLLIFSSVMASTLSARLGMPLLLLFLVIGMLAGEEGILGIEFSQYNIANLIGQAALACILLDGGLRTSVNAFRIGLKPAVTLATGGVFATVVLLGVFVTWLLDVDWRIGLLMAAIVGSTDAAAVFSLLRNGGVKLKDKVQATLELESGANDPFAILLVIGLIALNVDPAGQSVLGFIGLLAQQLGFGLVMGVISGYALAKMLPKVHLPVGMYAILILSAGLAVFAATNIIGGSGFLAVYLAGVVVGNKKVRATEHVLRVMDSFAWLSQAVLFLVLGLLVTPSNVIHVWHYSVAIALFMILIARPVAVFLSTKPFGFTMNEIGFISWVGLRGAVPITLAILPIIAGVEDAFLLFDIAFGVVILSLVLQGSTIPIVANLFKVKVPKTPEPEEEMEIWVSDEASITLFEFEVKSGAFAIGRYPKDISSRINNDEIELFALVRLGQIIHVDDDTRLQIGDRVWYGLRGDHASTIARIFNNFKVDTREVDTFYGDWLVSPHVKLGDLPVFKGRQPKAMDADTQVDNEIALWEQTASEYILANLTKRPICGDKVAINEEWSFIVNDVDDHGLLKSVELKHYQVDPPHP